MHMELASNQIKTALDPDTEACVIGGVGHDFRENHHVSYGVPRISWVCVWCHGIACGNYKEEDPCMEIYHHTTPHKARSGKVWHIGQPKETATA